MARKFKRFLTFFIVSIVSIVETPDMASAAEIKSPGCKGLWVEYTEGPFPKAFALSQDGRQCGYATSRSCATGSLNCIKVVALEYCKESGDGCRVIQVKEN